MNRSTALVVAAASVYLLVVTPAVTLVLLVAAFSQDSGAGCDTSSGGGAGGGQQQLGGQVWSAEQTGNAQTIVATTASRNLPKRAAVIAVTAAITETGLHNDNFGDRDSLGLFQERPSAGWGTPEQVTNPSYATGKFLDHLLLVPGWDDPQRISIGAAAQAVEVSAFPDRYQPHAAEAQALVDRFWQGPDNPAPPGPGAPPAQLVSVVTGCPDQGASNLPLDRQHSHQLPAGWQPPADPQQRAVVAFAIAQIGKPYVWGAKGPNAFDCSGLVQAAWAAVGVGLTGSTYDQVHEGTPVASIDQAEPGDVVFIPGSLGSPTHPGHDGLYVGQGLIIDAYDSQTGVVVDSVNAWRGQIVAIRRPAAPVLSALAGGM